MRWPRRVPTNRLVWALSLDFCSSQQAPCGLKLIRHPSVSRVAMEEPAERLAEASAAPEADAARSFEKVVNLVAFLLLVLRDVAQVVESTLPTLFI